MKIILLCLVLLLSGCVHNQILILLQINAGSFKAIRTSSEGRFKRLKVKKD